MNITKKRLYKIKKTKNQSKRHINKKSNKKKKNGKLSRKNKRNHNLKNKTLKLNKKSKLNISQVGGDETNDSSVKELWYPSSEELNINDIDVDLNDTEELLWSPSSEDDNEDVNETDNEQDNMENKDDSKKQKDGEKNEEDEEEEKNEEDEEEEKNEKEEEKETNKILLNNLFNNDKSWTPFMNSLLKVCCIHSKIDKRKDDENEEKDDEEKTEILVDDELVSMFDEYYRDEDLNNRKDELYKNASSFFDIIRNNDKSEGSDTKCDNIDYKSGYEKLNDMMEDDDSYEEKEKYIKAIHNQVILDKENIIEKIIKSKNKKDSEEKKGEKNDEKIQSGGANRDLKWFKEFKKEMKEAKYSIEENVFIPKTDLIINLNLSDEKNRDIVSSYTLPDSNNSETVGDIMKGITHTMYSLSKHVDEANKVKKGKSN
jgi:hypothetical protein